MEQTVYIDIFFLINFSMDLLCFFLTSKLLTHPLSLKRTVIAAFLGGVYACVSLFIALRGIFSALLDILACGVMCTVAYKRKGNLKEICQCTVVYAAVSIVLGGAMTVLFSLFNKLGLDRMLGTEEDADGISVWLFAILAAVSGGLALFGGAFFKRKSARTEGEIEICYGNKNTRFKAFCDSGNLLVEPISAKPCIVVEKSEMERILPCDMAKTIKSGKTEELSTEEIKRIRIIPTGTVGGSSLLYAVRVDEIRINMGKGWSIVDALVAFGEIGKNAYGAKALIPSAVVFGAV